MSIFDVSVGAMCDENINNLTRGDKIEQQNMQG